MSCVSPADLGCMLLRHRLNISVSSILKMPAQLSPLFASSACIGGQGGAGGQGVPPSTVEGLAARVQVWKHAGRAAGVVCYMVQILV
jgi:hypothetical protein